MELSRLPALNASLNSLSAFFLVLGYIFIRRKAVKAHIVCMLSAVITSILFITSYLYYHYYHGTTHFPGHGPVRPVYFTILITHTILAGAIVPMIVLTLTRALKGQFLKHRAVARVTLPLWLYVSVTGVVIYWMLYRVSYAA